MDETRAQDSRGLHKPALSDEGKGSRCMLHCAQWYGWRVLFGRKKIVPTWNCSQQGLWIILSNQVMISAKSHRCCVFQIYFWATQGECHPVPLRSIEGRHLYSQLRPNSATHTKTVQMDKQLNGQQEKSVFLIWGELSLYGCHRLIYMRWWILHEHTWMSSGQNKGSCNPNPTKISSVEPLQPLNLISSHLSAYVKPNAL